MPGRILAPPEKGRRQPQDLPQILARKRDGCGRIYGRGKGRGAPITAGRTSASELQRRQAGGKEEEAAWARGVVPPVSPLGATRGLGVCSLTCFINLLLVRVDQYHGLSRWHLWLVQINGHGVDETKMCLWQTIASYTGKGIETFKIFLRGTYKGCK